MAGSLRRIDAALGLSSHPLRTPSPVSSSLMVGLLTRGLSFFRSFPVTACALTSESSEVALHLQLRGQSWNRSGRRRAPTAPRSLFISRPF